MTDPTARETLVNRLFRIPARTTAIVLIAMIVVGLLLGGPVGGVLLVAAILVMAGMLALMWVDLQPVERMMRLSVIACVLALSIVRLVPAG